jgi:hypothetical protein
MAAALPEAVAGSPELAWVSTNGMTGASVNSGLTDHSTWSGEFAKASGFADLPPRSLVNISCFANGIPLRKAHSLRSPESRGQAPVILSPFGYIVIALGARRCRLFKGKRGRNAKPRCGGATLSAGRHFAFGVCGLEARGHSARLRGSFRYASWRAEGVPNLLADPLAQVLSGRRMSRRLRSCRLPHPKRLEHQGPVGASGREQCHNP